MTCRKLHIFSPNSKGKNVANSNTSSKVSRTAFRTAPVFASAPASIVVALALALGACSKPVERVEEVRPVRALRVSAGGIDSATEFSGEVRPRYESRLGFRVGGKIAARKVDVGTVVKRGQVLMQLDPQDLQLAQAQANAGLKAAETNRDLAKAEYKRYQDLREKNFVSQAVLDAKETAFKAAQATFEQATAGYRNQSNQAGYASLVADVDGVVTGVDAEAGQVVAAGAPVVRVAQTKEKEVVIGIPEDRVDSLRANTDVRVRTWARPDESIPGKLRELAPVADPATRTYLAKIAVPNAPETLRLGMTAYVAFASKSPNQAIRLPLTALYKDKTSTAVWVIEKDTVKLAPVQVTGTAGNDVLIGSGVSPGQTVVTAGVNLLKPGQKVKILDEGSNAQVAATSPGAPQ
jgi:membrane fusion protein, multidrug efflux system